MLSLRQNKKSRRDGGHAPPQRHLKSRERGDENEVHGEKTTERASCEVRLLSSRHILKIPSFPGHAPGKDTLRAANAATKVGVNGGENGLSEAITRCRPRLNLSSRQFFTASTCLPLRRAVRCPIPQREAPARHLKRCRRIGGKGFCAVCIRTLTAKDLWCMN